MFAQFSLFVNCIPVGVMRLVSIGYYNNFIIVMFIALLLHFSTCKVIWRSIRTIGITCVSLNLKNDKKLRIFLRLMSLCLSYCLLNFYIFDFSKTTRPFVTKLSTNHPYVKGIQNCSSEGQTPSPGGDSSKRVEINWTFLKKPSPELAGQFQWNVVQIILR
jgi:hypothetical protein